MEKLPTSIADESLQSEGSRDTMQKPSASNVDKSLEYEGSRDIMQKPSASNVDKSLKYEKLDNGASDPCSAPVTNIILNHDFSGGLHLWHPNCCDAFVASEENGYPKELSAKLSGRFAVITNRKECWQGLEQDITTRVSAGSTYTVCASVGVSGHQGATDVLATLKLEYQDSSVCYLFIGRTSASMEKWEKLQGTFSLSTMPHRVIFYLEGPSPGIDLLIRSVVVSCQNHSQYDGSRDIMQKPSASNVNKSYEKLDNGASDPCSAPVTNVILNHDFSGGLHLWHPNCCEAFVASEENGYPKELSAKLSGRFAVIKNRKECWQGLEQDITNRVSAGSTYTVCASVGVSGHQGVTDVLATLKLEYQDSSVCYLFIGRTSASMEKWEKLQGTFSLSTMPHRVIFYLEGPSPGIDLLIRSVVVSCHNHSQCDNQRAGPFFDGDDNIIQNPGFEDGLNNWSGRGCQIVLHDSMADGKVLPRTGKFFASTTKRTDNWHGIQQEISGRVQRKLAYEVTAFVRIFGNDNSADVRATLWLQGADLREQYIGIASVQATDKDWVELRGKFLVNGSPSRAVIYLEGPAPGNDILLNNLVVKHAAKAPPASPPVIENAAFGMNIIGNSNLNDGTNGWFPLGNCNLSVADGSPRIFPPMARDSLGAHEPLSGRYILVTNRTQTWMGPAQMITDKLKLYLTYQVSAWVRIGSQATQPQIINIALGVDGQWVNGGQVECTGNKWHEIGGSFRIEKQPAKVMVYAQGPDVGIDLMVAGLQIFPVKRDLRFRHLKLQTDKIRKRDVTLKFSASNSSTPLVGSSVKIRQTQNSFAFGSCISRSIIENEDVVHFFTKNFNWAVFENELKWYWTEPQRGNFNYKDADDLLNLCTSHNIQLRGHCIFWESEGAVQSWIRALDKNDMMSAVQNRLTGLLSRYKGKFKHYDVNNEMLHNSFYQDHLGKEIRAHMFKTANQLDPSATLFVNDYSVEDGSDARSCPDKYVQHIMDLQEQGAPIGGIGIQGHISKPVGPIVCSALDKLGILGLPIWLTEVDVSSDNEYVRADDLEVMIREAFAHPAVEGVMLWGFWELFMSRDNAWLVNAEGDMNEAGKRLVALKQEWLTHAHGHVSEDGEFEYRGFHGSYEVELVTPSKQKLTTTFVVQQGQDPLVISIQF